MALTRQELAELSRLLDEGLALPPHAREAWLRALPEAPSPLHQRLRRLLAAPSDDPDGTPGTPGARFVTLPRLAEPAPAAAQAGERVGPWRLLHEIGRGGMGTVWLAERADGAYGRQVALKLPRIALSERLVARMARERHIAARLEHPTIARLYDAGLDAQGRPFIAMEHIDGVPIDRWVREQHLGVRETLALFVPVVRAVAHAHGRLVVHRDLKPSNVLVGRDGQPHLLDFGIAEMLGDAGGAPEPWPDGGRALTPHYAAPEQLAGGAAGVASDIYSLGVMLQELLTGTLRSGAAVPASQEAIDPQRARALRGAVDALLAKAMAREPAARYATADALAEDLLRHLRDEPVLAHAESWPQRMRRLLRRHRLGVAAGSAVAAALLVGTALALVQAHRAGQEAERTRLVKGFVAELLRANSARVAEATLNRLPAEMLIQHGAGLIDERFRGQPALRAELHGMVAAIYLDMGLPRQGAEHASRQLDVLQTLRAPAAEQGRALLLQARALQDGQRHAEARAAAERAAGLLPADGDAALQAQLVLAQARLKLGETTAAAAGLAALEAALAPRAAAPSALRAEALWLRGQLAELDNRFEDMRPLATAAIDEALAAEGPRSVLAAGFRLRLAYALVVRSHADDAAREMRLGLQTLRELGGPNRVRAATEAAALTRQRRLMGQITHVEAIEAVAFEQDELRPLGALVPPPVHAWLDFERATILSIWGDVAASLPLLERALPELERQVDSLDERWRLVTHAGSLAMLAGQHALAERLLGERMAIRRQQGRGHLPFASFDHYYVALNLGMQGRGDEALAVLDRAPVFEDEKGAAGGQGAGYPRVLPAARARLLIDAGRLDEALEIVDRIRSFGSEIDNTTLMRSEILCRKGRGAEGLAPLESALQRLQGRRHPDHPPMLRMRAVAGLCALDARQPARARELAREARASASRQPAHSAWFRQPLDELERRLGRPG